MLKFVFCLLLCGTLYAKIIDTPKLEVFEEALIKCDQNSLVIFDVDDTLIIPKDLILQSSAREDYLKCIRDLIPKGKFPPYYISSKILSSIQYLLVSPRLVDIVQDLQKKNIKTIACTKMKIGSFGIIPSLEDWRIQHLKKLGFHFEKSFPSDFVIEVNGSPIGFKGGVLCCNDTDKGPALKAFLEKINFTPSQILFLDDKFEYLESVDKTIPNNFYGFHFTEVKNRNLKPDLEVARCQFRHLATTGEWLSEEQAKESIHAIQTPS